MEINYLLTEEDYINFNIYHIKNSKMGKKALNLQRFISPFIFLICAFIFSEISDIPLFISLITFLIMSFLWVLFYPNYFFKQIARNAKKMIKEGKNEGLLGNQRMVMTDKGIVNISLTSETKITWEGIKHFKESEEYLYLYNSSVSSYILPKRELEQVDEVRDYIRAKITQ